MVSPYFPALGCALALVLAAAPAPEGCTSIRIKTADGLVFYARTMEGPRHETLTGDCNEKN